MNRLFDNNPKVENSNYRIRLVRKKDLIELINIYSNKENLKYINKDDCNGDNFYFDDLSKLEKKYSFWKYAYRSKWFVRMTIISKKNNQKIGMIELMKIHSYDSFNEGILLRLDLLLELEKKDIIKEILTLICDKILKACDYKKIVIKSCKFMNERTNCLVEMGFKLSNRMLVGKDDNKQYKDYYVKNRFSKFS